MSDCGQGKFLCASQCRPCSMICEAYHKITITPCSKYNDNICGECLEGYAAVNGESYCSPVVAVARLSVLETTEDLSPRNEYHNAQLRSQYRNTLALSVCLIALTSFLACLFVVVIVRKKYHAKMNRMIISPHEVELLQITNRSQPEIENMKNESEELNVLSYRLVGVHLPKAESNSSGSTGNCMTTGSLLHDSNTCVTTESYSTSESETDSGCIMESVAMCEEDLRASDNLSSPKYSVSPSTATDTSYTAFINLRKPDFTYRQDKESASDVATSKNI